MHYCSKNFVTVEEGVKVLQSLRTGIMRIIRKKKRAGMEISEKDVENEMNHLDLNIYVDTNSFVCKIGDGGTLLVINIVGNSMEYEWNDLCGTIEELSPKDIERFRIAIGG